jgi:hypothetical protein
MGDSSFTTLLSLVPLLIIVASIVAAGIAWRSTRRTVRTVVAILLILGGATFIFSSIGVLFSVAGGVLLCLFGLLLLIAEYAGNGSA